MEGIQFRCLPGRTTLCNVIADETLHLYEALVATCPGLERRGRTMPYTSINGHMFPAWSRESRCGS